MTAEDVQDLRSEIAIEIYQTCAFIGKKSAKIVEAKINALDNNQMGESAESAVDVDGYLTMMDLINTKINAFKQKYAEMKELAIAEYKEELAAISMSKEVPEGDSNQAEDQDQA